MSLIANLHGETFVLAPRQDGLGVILKLDVLSHHCEDGGPRVVSTVDLSPDQGGKLIHALCDVLGFACELTPVITAARLAEDRAKRAAQASGAWVVDLHNRRRAC